LRHYAFKKNSNTIMSNPIEQYGFTAVPRSLDKLIAGRSTGATSKAVTVDGIELPNTPLAKSIQAYAKEHLPRQTYNHSMRVYYYGKNIQSKGVTSTHKG
jgi:cyanamide hydratase